MVLWGFWVLAALQSPAHSSAQFAAGQFAAGQFAAVPFASALGLAVVAAALLVVLAASGLSVTLPPAPRGFRAVADRARVRHVPRLIDPDAAGRPRPRAPSAFPAAA